RGLLLEERDGERPPLGIGQRLASLAGYAREQVSEAREDEIRFGLGGPRNEDAASVGFGEGDPGLPDRGLADPRVALEHERPRAGVARSHELRKPCQLLVPPYDLAGCSRTREHSCSLNCATSVERRLGRARNAALDLDLFLLL